MHGKLKSSQFCLPLGETMSSSPNNREASPKKMEKTGFDMLFNSEQKQPTPKPDRISALPDKTLAHILSFLPTKSAVATCIISPRWRNLWASVPVLDFFDHDHNHNRARSNDFDFSMSDWKSVPRQGSKLRIQLPNSVWFPSLNILELSVLYPDNDMTQKLSCGCSVLEDLFIEAELEEGSEVVLIVVKPTLKRLTIDMLTESDVQYHDNKIIVDTPSLEYLSVHDDNLGCYSVEDMPSLVKAGIDVGQGSIKDRDHANRIYDILKGLSNVQSLSLFYSMEVLELAGDGNLHVFHNVTHVDMHICIHIVWPCC